MKCRLVALRDTVDYFYLSAWFNSTSPASTSLLSIKMAKDKTEVSSRKISSDANDTDASTPVENELKMLVSR